MCEFCKGGYKRLTPTDFTKKKMMGGIDLHNGKLQINEKQPNWVAWSVVYEIEITHCPMCGQRLKEDTNG